MQNFELLMTRLGEGMVTTIWIFAVTLLLALPFGMIVAFGRMSKNVIIRNIVRVYISIMRGTPLMLQLLVVYFGPYFIFGMRLTPNSQNLAVIIGFTLNYAA